MCNWKNRLCCLSILCLTAFINTFAVPVNFHSESSDEHQYLNNWPDSEEVDKKDLAFYKTYQDASKPRTDPTPFYLSLFRAIDRTEIQSKSRHLNRRSMQRWLMKHRDRKSLEKSANNKRHLMQVEDVSFQDTMTYFEGQPRQQRISWFDRKSSIIGYRTKRNIESNDERHERSVSAGKQKKAKMLSRLLMNGAVNKNDVNEQDDYVDEEDDDYFRGRNDDKMNWKDYENADGPSVMELIALNVRHKANNWRSYKEGPAY